MKHIASVSLLILGGAILPANAQWTTVGGNAQHTGLSATGAQPLNRIKWSTPVDQSIYAQIQAGTFGGTIYEHFGAPIITARNTVFVPVTGSTAYEIEVHSGATGALQQTLTTDWTPPPHNWIPSFAPALSARNRFYYPGAGGTVYYLDSPDTTIGPSGQIAFYGNASYLANQAALNSTVMISTPIVSDRYGNIFFGYTVTGSNPVGLQSGIARISSTGAGTYMNAVAAAGGDATISKLQTNCAPVLSSDHTILYFGVNNGSSGGDLVAVNATTLAPIGIVRLTDPNTGTDAVLPDDSSASPMVGPDGDVYFGVFEAGGLTHNDRGWMLHFNRTLTQVKTPGSFGWDAIASVVPAAIVPQYHGTSAYLIFTKYNNYKDFGIGDGNNKIAVLDPNSTEADPLIPGVSVMKEVMTISGVTPDPSLPAVKEWCINSAAIDLLHKSAIVNSEDGVLYRWDFTTNTFTQSIRLTPGIGEAYTPTVIGPDGTAYAINDAQLFAVGQ